MDRDFQRTLNYWRDNSQPRKYLTHEITIEDLLESFEIVVKKATTLGGKEITATRLLAYELKHIPQLPSIWRKVMRAYRKEQYLK